MDLIDVGVISISNKEDEFPDTVTTDWIPNKNTYDIEPLNRGTIFSNNAEDTEGFIIDQEIEDRPNDLVYKDDTNSTSVLLHKN